jgi:hypothetical protein
MLKVIHIEWSEMDHYYLSRSTCYAFHSCLRIFSFFSCKCACRLMKQLIIRFDEEKKLTNICLCVWFTHPRRLVSLLPERRTYRDLNLHHRSLSTVIKTRKIIIIFIHNERQLRAIPSCICSTDHHHLHCIH